MCEKQDYEDIKATAETYEVKAGEDGVTEATLENLSNNKGED